MIDIKKRLTNKVFWVSTISLLILVLNDVGVAIPPHFEEILDGILNLFVLLGIVVDTSTEGVSDKHE